MRIRDTGPRFNKKVPPYQYRKSYYNEISWKVCIFISNQSMEIVFCSQFSLLVVVAFNTLRPRHNGRHFADDILKCIFLNENVWILIKISLTFVTKSPINSIPALVQIIAWRRPGDKPLSEPMMLRLPTHIRVKRPQRVKSHTTYGQMNVTAPLTHVGQTCFSGIPLVLEQK